MAIFNDNVKQSKNFEIWKSSERKFSKLMNTTKSVIFQRSYISNFCGTSYVRCSAFTLYVADIIH